MLPKIGLPKIGLPNIGLPNTGPAPNAASPLPDPPLFSVYNDTGKAPVLLVADHASRNIPAALQQLGLDDAAMEKHIAWDIGSADLARALADQLDAPLILAGYSRLIIDLNRQPDDPTAMPPISDGIVIPGNQMLDEQQKSWRIETYFRPYHAAITARLDQFEQAGVTPALLSIHSCTPVYGNVQRPWQIGVMWDKDPRIASRLLQRLNQLPDLCIGDNQPYSGRHPHDYTIDFHAEGRGLPHAGIEVRQDLLNSPDDARHWAGVLAEALSEPLADPGIYRLFAPSQDSLQASDH